MRIERLPGFLQTYPQEQRKPRTSSSFRRHDPSDLPRTLSCASRWRHGRNSARRSGLSVFEKGPCLRTGDSFRNSRECYSALPTFPRTSLVRPGGAVDASEGQGRSRLRSTRPALRRPRRNPRVPHSVRQLHAGASHTQARQAAARTKCKNNGHCRGTVSLAPMQACAYRRYDQRRHCTGRNRIQERS